MLLQDYVYDIFYNPRAIIWLRKHHTQLLFIATLVRNLCSAKLHRRISSGRRKENQFLTPTGSAQHCAATSSLTATRWVSEARTAARLFGQVIRRNDTWPSVKTQQRSTDKKITSKIKKPCTVPRVHRRTQLGIYSASEADRASCHIILKINHAYASAFLNSHSFFF